MGQISSQEKINKDKHELGVEYLFTLLEQNYFNVSFTEFQSDNPPEPSSHSRHLILKGKGHWRGLLRQPRAGVDHEVAEGLL